MFNKNKMFSLSHELFLFLKYNKNANARSAATLCAYYRIQFWCLDVLNNFAQVKLGACTMFRVRDDWWPYVGTGSKTP